VGNVENHDIEEPERFGPPEPACPCGCGAIWPDPCEGVFGMKELTLYKIDSELEGLLDYRQSRVENPVEPATAEELAVLDDEIQRYMARLCRRRWMA
jgi:hypothetical protein